jgi:hypothetical protein
MTGRLDARQSTIVRAFDARHGRREKQQSQNTSDDFKYDHWLTFCRVAVSPASSSAHAFRSMTRCPACGTKVMRKGQLWRPRGI